jgi:hypothetical protein
MKINLVITCLASNLRDASDPLFVFLVANHQSAVFHRCTTVGWSAIYGVSTLAHDTSNVLYFWATAVHALRVDAEQIAFFAFKTARIASLVKAGVATNFRNICF